MASQAKRDYYEVLGVGRSASEQEIKDAFLKLAAEFQAAGKPRNIDDVEEIRSFATAYRVLSNAEKRTRNDRSGLYLPVEADLTSEDRSKLDELDKDSESYLRDATELIAGIVSGFAASFDLT